MAAAKAAQPAWAKLSPKERGACLKKFAALLRQNGAELARLEALSMGRPVRGYNDNLIAAGKFEYFSEAGYNVQGQSSLNTPGFLNVTLRQPFGVVAAIIPWNVPLVMFSLKVAPALAAGNAVVLKSSEKAPLTVRLTHKIWSTIQPANHFSENLLSPSKSLSILSKLDSRQVLSISCQDMDTSAVQL